LAVVRTKQDELDPVDYAFVMGGSKAIQSPTLWQVLIRDNGDPGVNTARELWTSTAGSILDLTTPCGHELGSVLAAGYDQSAPALWCFERTPVAPNVDYIPAVGYAEWTADHTGQGQAVSVQGSLGALLVRRLSPDQDEVHLFDPNTGAHTGSFQLPLVSGTLKARGEAILIDADEGIVVVGWVQLSGGGDRAAAWRFTAP
jgi:hypothetical protein